MYKFCKEKDFEACVIKLYLSCCAIGTVSIYRSPSGNFEYFLDKLDSLLNFVKGNSMELILCGDFNINFLNDSTQNQFLTSLLATYGLSSTLQFPTRICNNSISQIDIIFINTTKYNNFMIYPMINGMSDHDARFIILHDITMANDSSHFYFTRKINEASVLDFNLKLSL